MEKLVLKRSRKRCPTISVDRILGNRTRPMRKSKRERERERERGGQIVNKKAIVLLSGPVVRRNGRRGGSSPFLERGPTDCPERMVAA